MYSDENFPLAKTLGMKNKTSTSRLRGRQVINGLSWMWTCVLHDRRIGKDVPTDVTDVSVGGGAKRPFSDQIQAPHHRRKFLSLSTGSKAQN